MKTPKQKAKELVDKFMTPIDPLHKYPMCFDTAMECSIICVQEILKVTYSDKRASSPFDKEWWEKVLNELEKL